MENMTPEMRTTLTRATMHILDSWELGVEEMRAVLGMEEQVRGRSFQKFRTHQAFPEDPVIDRRAEFVLKIAGALKTTYPVNDKMALRWLRQRNSRLGRPPLAMMIQNGENGLLQVLAELDCTYMWELNDTAEAFTKN